MKGDMVKGAKSFTRDAIAEMSAHITNRVREVITAEIDKRTKAANERSVQLKRQLDTLKVNSNKAVQVEVNRRLAVEKDLGAAQARIVVLEERLKNAADIDTAVEKVEAATA